MGKEKRFRPNMPSRKSADSRSARFASDPVSNVQEEEQQPVDTIVEETVSTEPEVESTNLETPVVAPIIEPGQLIQTHEPTMTLPSSTIVRQPWKQENKQSKGYVGWAINSVSNLVSFNVMLAVAAVGLAYYFFMYRKRGVAKQNVPEVEEQTERKSEGAKSVRSSLKFKSPTMILTEIRKNPSVKVAPSIAKK